MLYLALVLTASAPLRAQLTPAATAAFNSYSETLELRLARQHRSPESFLAVSDRGGARQRLRGGEQIIERLSPAADSNPAGSMLHQWRGTAFVPGARAAEFERLMRDVSSYPRNFSPQVMQARLVSQNGDRMRIGMRLRQRHVITVVLDSSYEITFGRLDPRHGYSISRSQRIVEVDGAGTAAERTLSAKDEHGFLWRLNTYWSCEERDGGLYLQVEAVSLTRSIPAGLGWAVRPYVESIPRESLEFTLRSMSNALRK